MPPRIASSFASTSPSRLVLYEERGSGFVARLTVRLDTWTSAYRYLVGVATMSGVPAEDEIRRGALRSRDEVVSALRDLHGAAKLPPVRIEYVADDSGQRSVLCLGADPSTLPIPPERPARTRSTTR